MWKNSNGLIDAFANLWWKQRNVIPLSCEPVSAPMFHETIINMLNGLTEDLLAIINRHRFEAQMPSKFRKDLADLFVPLARDMTTDQDYFLIEALWVLHNYLDDGSVSAKVVRQLALSLLHLLLGTEKRVLVGTRDEQPAWKSVAPSSNAADYMYYIPVLELRYISQGEVDLLPDMYESMPAPRENYFDWVDIPIERITGLLERAYYNQRYIVHPEGAFVRLRHTHGITGVTLKVLPGERDPNYVDFLAVFDIEPGALRNPQFKHRGKFLFVLDGSFATGQVGIKSNEKGSVGLEHYLGWLIALIYDDLVTSEHIHIGKREEAAPATPQLPEDPSAEPSWIYIPRKYGGIAEPRCEVPTPRIMSPHRVTGHLRRGNISEQQKLELIKFEQETGLEVLKIVERNPGFTFVRPHISPAGFALSELPRFIHARLQSDIDRLMRAPTIKGEPKPA
jgi:hypothetical protein